MKRSYVLAAILALALCSPFAFASLYFWNDARRPPISLREALTRAEKLLGDEAPNRYCVAVSLYGDETGDGKKGAWNLFFTAADGSKKNVYIDMQGNSRVTLWNGPIDPKKNEGARKDLGDVRRRLEELFAKEGIAAEFDAQVDGVTVQHHTRTFRVHPERDDGSHGEELWEMPGPAADGVWLRLQIVDAPDRRVEFGCDDGPYWRWHRGTYVLTQPGKFLAVDLRYGRKVKDGIVTRVRQVFGERTP
jgi:hypothetical protein